MAYTTSKAMAGRGTQFFLGGITGTPNANTYVLVGECDSTDLSEMDWSFEDTSNFESGVYMETMTTMLDPGTVKVSGNYIAGGTDPGQVAFNAALASGQPYNIKLILPLNPLTGQTTIGDTFTCSAFVSKGGGMSIDTKKKIGFSAELKITGPRAWTWGN